MCPGCLIPKLGNYACTQLKIITWRGHRIGYYYYMHVLGKHLLAIINFDQLDHAGTTIDSLPV